MAEEAGALLGVPRSASGRGAPLRRESSGARFLSVSEPGPAVLTAVFVAAAIALTFRHLDMFGSRIPGNSGDGLLNLWIMRAVQTGLPHGWRALWDAPIFYPASTTLGYSDSLIPVALATWPLRTLFGDAAAFNLVYLGSWVLSSWCMYRLARRFVTYWGAALVASFAYTYSAMRVVHSQHFQLVVGGALVPLVLLLLLRCTDEPSTRNALSLGVAFSALTLTASYFGAMMGIFVVVLAAGSIKAERAENRRRLLIALGIAGATVLVLAAPVGIRYLLLERQATFRRSFLPAAAAHLSDFWASGFDNYFLRHLPIIGRYSQQPARSVENRLFPGLVASVFGIAGTRVMVSRLRTDGRHDPRLRQLLLIAIAGVVVVVLSFGDWFRIFGTKVPLPFTLFRHAIPGFTGIRATSRLALGGELALALLAAVGVDWFVAWRHPRDGMFAAATTIALSLAVIAESAMLLFFVTVPTASADGRISETLHRLPPGPVLELPIESDANGYAWPFVETPRQLAAIRSGDPLVNGYSGFEPPGFAARTTLLNHFPAPDALAEIRRLGVRYIVLRTTLVGTDMPADQLAYLETDGVGRFTVRHADELAHELPPRAVAHIYHLPGGLLIQLEHT